MLKALILAPFSEGPLTQVRSVADVTYESWLDTGVMQDPEELGARLMHEEVVILVVESDFVFEEIFKEAPSLRFVGACRGSPSNVDVEAATRHRVLVVNTPGRNARAVAEHALGLMLALARRIPGSHAYVVEGEWQNPLEPYMAMRGIELGGRTVGIVGLGAIGTTLANLALAINMKVIAFDPYVDNPNSGVHMTDISSVMSESDFVSIHAPLTPETDGLIDTGLLLHMKTTAYLLNLSDSAIVSEDALTEALSNNRIAGAALDVFATHPIDPNSPLLRLSNVILTPHIGGATAETVDRHSQAMATDILRFVEGRRPVNLVNPKAWTDDA